MTALARRDLLAALFVVTASAGLPSLAAAVPSNPKARLFGDLDLTVAARVGEAWLAGRAPTTVTALAARLFPRGREPEALSALRRAVADDFRRGAVFVHRGWRLSDTEGALFGLLALEAR